MSQVQMNYIAGEWVEGESTVSNINPSNHREVVGEFALKGGVRSTARVSSFSTMLLKYCVKWVTLQIRCVLV